MFEKRCPSGQEDSSVSMGEGMLTLSAHTELGQGPGRLLQAVPAHLASAHARFHSKGGGNRIPTNLFLCAEIGGR